jgi:hypothetical protein
VSEQHCPSHNRVVHRGSIGGPLKRRRFERSPSNDDDLSVVRDAAHVCALGHAKVARLSPRVPKGVFHQPVVQVAGRIMAGPIRAIRVIRVIRVIRAIMTPQATWRDRHCPIRVIRMIRVVKVNRVNRVRMIRVITGSLLHVSLYTPDL